MTLRTAADIISAKRAGRFKSVGFLKNANLTGADGVWWDWSFTSGRPAYDARIGDALTFTPFVSVGNDAIYLPPVPAGMERQFAGLTFKPQAANTNQVGISCEVYDLIGVYPLIDGDSTDLQEFDNTMTLPRYTDGDNVTAVLVNHVAPMIQAADGTMVYTSSNGAEVTVGIRAALTGQNRVCSAYPTAGGAGPIGMPMGNGCCGVRNVKSLVWSTAPGGLFAIYLVRLLGSFQHWTDPVYAALTSGNKIAMERCNCIHNGWDMPRVYDGATLGMFFMTSGGGRTLSMVGQFNFIWG